MSLLTICQTVLRETGMPDDGLTTVTGATGFYKMLVEAVIEADVFIQGSSVDWRFLWNTWTQVLTIGANSGLYNEYTPPTTVRAFISDDYATLIGTNPIRIYEYESNRTLANSTLSGTPTAMILLPNKKVRLTPIPTAALTLTAEYFRTPLKMSADADVSLIPAEFERAIVTLAKAKVNEYNESWEGFNQAMLEHAVEMTKLESSQLFGHAQRTMGANADNSIRAE